MAKSTSKPSGLEHDACVILHQMQTMKVQIQSIAPVHESLNLQLLQYQVNPQLLQMAQHQLHYMQVQQQLQGVTQQMHTYQRMYDQWGQHLRAIKNMYQTNNACDAQYKVPVDEYALEQERLEKERIPRENAQQHEAERLEQARKKRLRYINAWVYMILSYETPPVIVLFEGVFVLVIYVFSFGFTLRNKTNN
eukprot:929024_1